MVFTGKLNRPSVFSLMTSEQLDAYYGEEITDAEWREMNAIRKAIKDHPASVHPDKMERFSELFVQTLIRKSFQQTDENI